LPKINYPEAMNIQKLELLENFDKNKFYISQVKVPCCDEVKFYILAQPGDIEKA
jgi:hypothetical protein